MVNTAPAPDSLSERLVAVQRRIEVAALVCGRASEKIRLVGITKTHPVATIVSGLTLGLQDLGENKVQEAEPKILAIERVGVRWHLVGHLQANKARRAVKLFDMIHSLDSVSLAQRLDRLCVEEGRSELPVLIQVNLAAEVTKSGISESELPRLLTTLKQCHRLSLKGLMTLPPFSADPEEARPFFRRLRELRDELEPRGAFSDSPGELSMGMTNDFEVAIAEGATILRIGTAIFGERNSVSA